MVHSKGPLGACGLSLGLFQTAPGGIYLVLIRAGYAKVLEHIPDVSQSNRLEVFTNVMVSTEEMQPLEKIQESSLPKLLIADDHHLILDALKAMMRMQFDVVAVDNGEDFIKAVDQSKPDVAILDVSMPSGNGFAIARKVLESHPGLPIMFLSMHGERGYIDQATQLGAKAFLSKRIPADELISAIRTVLAGGSLLEESQSNTVAEAEKSGLTVRQKDVLRLIAEGFSAKDIANRLNISVRTAEFHRAAIMQRLKLRSTAQMTRYAISNNIA